MLTRVRQLCSAGVINTRERDELLVEVREGFQAFQDARDKLGAATVQYDGLRKEFVTCRAQGHSDSEYIFIGYNIPGGYGRCYEATCTRCGSVGRRFRKPNGRSNGSYRIPPSGYSLEGANETLRRCDVNAIEGIADLDSYLTGLEKRIPKGKAGAVRSLRSVG